MEEATSEQDLGSVVVPVQAVVVEVGESLLWWSLQVRDCELQELQPLVALPVRCFAFEHHHHGLFAMVEPLVQRS